MGRGRSGTRLFAASAPLTEHRLLLVTGSRLRGPAAPGGPIQILLPQEQIENLESNSQTVESNFTVGVFV